MGDSRRFDLFAELIARNFPNKSARIADVAGGKGYLKLALNDLGYYNVVTLDKNRKAAKKQAHMSYKYGYFNYRTTEMYDCLVALHPDESSDHVALYASMHRIPAFICPCCIKPDAVPFNEKYNFHLWVNHLKRLARGMEVQELYLKMQGKNLVLVMRPRK